MEDDRTEFYEYEYLRGQQRDTHPALLEEYERRSAAALRDRPNVAVDVPYGPQPRQKLDIFPAQGRCRGSLLYFHAGYWQARDKSTFRFIAEPYAARGYNVILANYPLCPDVTLDALVQCAAESVPFLVDHLRDSHPEEPGLIVAGHSAGAHIAIELALRPWPSSIAKGHPIRSVIAISGIYELSPLINTPLNIKLGLSEDDAMRNSPLFRVEAVGIPATFVVGGLETSEFKRQSQEMAAAWNEKGNPAGYIEAAGKDHFTILEFVAGMDHPDLVRVFEDS